MKKDVNKLLPYLVPFFLVAISLSLTLAFGVNIFVSYFIKVVLGVGSIIFFWKYYKEIKVKFDFGAWFFGFLIIVAWIAIDIIRINVFGGNSEIAYDISGLSGIYFYLAILQKVIGMVVVAAVVEEMFMRSFLARLFINADFNKVKIGAFSWLSFIATTLIFGVLHGISPLNEWLIMGLVSGALFNVWLYYKKDLFSCIQCHASANLFLIIYVLITQNWAFW